MFTLRATLTALGILVLSLITSANAQFGYDPFAQQMNAYNQQMDALVQQQMQYWQQQSNQAYAQMQRFFIDYYRQQTGDYATPDNQALVLGDRLYCQHNPAQCQQNIRFAEDMTRISANAHARRMADIASWGNTMEEVGQINSGILDASQAGYMNRQQIKNQGQADFVRGAIWGEGNYTNSTTGTTYSLPVAPDPNTRYQTPDGYPLVFDAGTNTWYQYDSYGFYTPYYGQ